MEAYIQELKPDISWIEDGVLVNFSGEVVLYDVDFSELITFQVVNGKSGISQANYSSKEKSTGRIIEQNGHCYEISIDEIHSDGSATLTYTEVSCPDSGGSTGGSTGTGGTPYNGGNGGTPGDWGSDDGTEGDGSGGGAINTGGDDDGIIGFEDSDNILADYWADQIDDQNLTNPCAKKIWNALASSNVAFEQLQEFLGENPKAIIHLNNPAQSWFDQNIGVGNYAGTIGKKRLDGKLDINIYFNPSFLSNASSAAVTTIFMHELLHAEILRSLWEAEANVELLEKNFPELYQIYINYPNPLKDWHHEAIANLYRESIKNAMSETGYNSSNNEALSWLGLTRSVSWIQLLTETQRSAYRNVHNIERTKGGC